MPLGPKVAIIGAGSLRSGAYVLASLFNLPLGEETAIALCDQHDEALDLFDRLARAFASAVEIEPAIISTSSQEEALSGAETVILSFGLGSYKQRFEEWAANCGDLREADLARAVLLHHSFEPVNEILFREQPLSVINLVRPAELSSQLLAYEAIHLDWPPKLDEASRVPAAHQALRWVRGDETMYAELRANESSPLVHALLDKKPAPRNAFNSQAVAAWLEQLERSCPGSRPEQLAK